HLLETEFAVILLDVHMPEMDGLETAAMIRNRRQTAHTPIIFVTALSDELHTAQGYSLGAVDYILTPVVPEILRTKVAVFVDLYKKTQQVRRQAEAHVALARAEAARAAAEAATRRSAFLAEASTVLVRSLDHEAIPRGLARQAIPFLGDLCAVRLSVENDPGRGITALAWVDAAGGPCAEAEVTGAARLRGISGLIRRVMSTGRAELLPEIGTPAPDGAAPGAAPAPAAAAGRPGFEPHSALAVPLCARGRCLGAIAVALRGD